MGGPPVRGNIIWQIKLLVVPRGAPGGRGSCTLGALRYSQGSQSAPDHMPLLFMRTMTLPRLASALCLCLWFDLGFSLESCTSD